MHEFCSTKRPLLGIGKMTAIVILLLSAFILSGCEKSRLEQQESFVFGTRVDVTVAGTDPEKAKRAINLVLQEFDRLHRTYHAWKDSELTTANRAFAERKKHTVSPELAELIREAQGFSAQGEYLFDPGIGQLIALWGFQSDDFPAKRPAPQAIKHWQHHPASIADLQWLSNTTLRSQNPNVSLDFGGYLKGWALDRAAAILQEQGIQNALINIGGNILALGDKNGKPWRVGIQNPRAPGALATLELADGEAIGTSGDYQRYFELEGIRYPHLLDPRTGEPAHHTQAVTVLIPKGNRSGTRSDASSKPIFIAGPENWQAAAARMNIFFVLRINADGRIQVSENLSKRLQNLAPNITLEIIKE